MVRDLDRQGHRVASALFLHVGIDARPRFVNHVIDVRPGGEFRKHRASHHQLSFHAIHLGTVVAEHWFHMLINQPSVGW